MTDFSEIVSLLITLLPILIIIIVAKWIFKIYSDMDFDDDLKPRSYFIRTTTDAKISSEPCINSKNNEDIDVFITCNNCGATNKKFDTFCGYCGSSLIKGDTVNVKQFKNDIQRTNGFRPILMEE